jgi:hypothetical protein
MLNIVKVLQRPSVPAPNRLYFQKIEETNTFSIYITDSQGEIIDIDVFSGGQFDIVSLLSALINQPNGIAGLNSQLTLDTSIKIDGQENRITTSAGGYVWNDYSAPIEAKNISGGNNPSFNTYMGNFQGYLFHESTMNQVWCDFHIKHDYAMGTYLFPHAHWLPTTTATGTVRWGFEVMVAKGHGQQAFGNPVTVFASTTITESSLGMHMVTEVDDLNAIPPLNLEPDSFVKIRVFRDAAHATDTYPDPIHAWCCDLHYQVDKIGTINRLPNFFGPQP